MRLQSIILTLRRDKSGCSGDWIPLNMISSLKLDSIRWGNDRDSNTMTAAMLVCPGAGHQEQILVLRLEPRLRMKLREREVSQASRAWTGVLDD